MLSSVKGRPLGRAPSAARWLRPGQTLRAPGGGGFARELTRLAAWQGQFSAFRSLGRKESPMKILDSMVEMVRVVHGVAAKVARHDRDLAQQMKRASTSVALNGSEGLWAKAGKRRSRLEDSINSARETLMALRLAGACGYLPAAEAAGAADQVDSVIAVLWTLAHRR